MPDKAASTPPRLVPAIAHPFATWLASRCQPAPGQVPMLHLYMHYCTWCAEHGWDGDTPGEFTRLCKASGYPVVRTLRGLSYVEGVEIRPLIPHQRPKRNRLHDALRGIAAALVVLAMIIGFALGGPL